MESPDPQLLNEWMANWSDLTDFEVRPVISSAEATARVLGAAGEERKEE
jgi:hypothetical protein